MARGFSPSPETRDRIRSALKLYYQTHPATWSGTTRSAETRRKMSESAKRRWARITDRRMSAEQKLKIGAAMKRAWARRKRAQMQ